MQKLLMDGTFYRVRCRYETLGRSFRIPAGINAGETLAHTYEPDPQGTFYDYEMQIEPDPRYPEDYDAFFDAISDPGGRHLVVLPYGQGTITLDAYVSGGGDRWKGKLAGTSRWGGLTVSFTARSPSRLPE